MSQDIKPQPSEEVDLGQLFKLFGNAFNRLFKFIGSILNGLFLALAWLIFFIKRHFLKLFIAGVLGIIFGFVLDITSKPVYKSSLIIKQNYQTGEILYNLIERYNALISERDSISLGKDLKISPKEALSLTDFDMESILDENQKLKLFNNYKEEMDSIIASTLEFKAFSEKAKEYDYQYQRIILKATKKSVFYNILRQTIENVESSGFFKNEQQKDLAELIGRENIIRESLKESDSLQKVYQFVLEKSAESTSGSQTSVTIDNTEGKSITREYDLFISDLELRRELVEIEREKEDKRDIIEILSTEQIVGTLDKTQNVFGFSISKKIFYGLFLSMLVFVILLSIEFLKFLEQYKDKIK